MFRNSVDPVRDEGWRRCTWSFTTAFERQAERAELVFLAFAVGRAVLAALAVEDLAG